MNLTKRDKTIIGAGILVLMAAAALLVFFGSGPRYSADDFQNGPLVQADPELADAERAQLAQVIEEEFAGTVTTSSRIRKAAAYMDAGLYIQALEQLGQVSADSEPTAALLTARGNVLANMHQYRSAAESYSQAIERDKTYAPVYADFAELYLQHSEQRSAALGLYEKARDLMENEDLKAQYERKVERLKKSL